MAIKKREYYEGAALYRVICANQVDSIRYEPPFFVMNDLLSVLLKYSTKNRSPWGFTFSIEEQVLLKTRATRSRMPSVSSAERMVSRLSITHRTQA